MASEEDEEGVLFAGIKVGSDGRIEDSHHCVNVLLGQKLVKHDIRLNLSGNCVVCRPGDDIAKLTLQYGYCVSHGLGRALHYVLGRNDWLFFHYGAAHMRCSSCWNPRPQYQDLSDDKYYCFNCAVNLVEKRERERSLGVKSARKR